MTNVGVKKMLLLMMVMVELLLCTVPSVVVARKHELVLDNEKREYFIVSTFGLLQDGVISVSISDYSHSGELRAVGFSIHRSPEESTQYNLNQNQFSCFLSSSSSLDANTILVPLNTSTGTFQRPLNNFSGVTLTFLDNTANSTTTMLVSVSEVGIEDIYTLAFHICSKSPSSPAGVTMKLSIVEMNSGPEYLGAGESALPAVYFTMASIFGTMLLIWIFVLYKCRASPNFHKVHWLMFVLVMCKFLALLFHAIDYHYISTTGVPIEGWAIPYYIFYFSRGILLFVTVLLIGAGFGFIKHALSDREKKLILFVLSLQVLSNVSFIVLEETSEGTIDRTTWRSIGLLVDLACCAAILFPVIWSIRHLRESSQIDGKAEISLQKLRLFRRFYVMVLTYIYATRILVYLIQSTIPFRYTWTAALLDEIITVVFYVSTGYMFSPMPDNKYFLLPQEEDSIPLDEIVTTTGANEGLRNVRPEVRETTLRQYRKSQQKDTERRSLMLMENEDD